MSAPFYEQGPVTVYHGDCIEVMRTMADVSVDAIVTDPPYGLGFMGKEWDDLPPGAEFAAEAFRVLKPGGHLLAFGGTRTWHRLAVAVEDAGFEIRDSIAWLYGSGFPKSLDVSKAIDKAAGVEFSAKPAAGVGFMNAEGAGGYNVTKNQLTREGESTAEAQSWEGWGTALKPAFEPIVVARKPFRGTVAANVLAYGTGALNIDANRVAHGSDVDLSRRQRQSSDTAGFGNMKAGHEQALYAEAGRFPANVLLDESQAGELDKQSGTLTSGANPTRRGSDKFRNAYGDFKGQTEIEPARGADSGGASRFFPTFRYEAKAPGSERPEADGVQHPTVKPLDLMRWLVRLVTPPGGIVLEPFAGSGTTIEAALLEGFQCIAIEREASYLPLIMQRITKPLQGSLFDFGSLS